MADRLAIVTGTSSGIGAALAQRLLDDGWLVFGVARREVSFAGGNYQHVQADLADPSLAGQLASRIQAELAFRTIDRLALINNAATPGQRRSYGRQDSGTTFQNIATNLAAPMALMDLALRLRPAGTPLRIVNLSSGLAYRPLEGAADYCASKAGLHMAGEVCALESEGEDIAVLSYSPGIVDTEMQQTLRGESAEDFPSVDVFRAMHEESRLAAAGRVLGPMVQFLEDAAVRGFHEARFDPEGDA
jgi:benzil reductase ((S)-benzoin forming)